ncbi:MAG: galactose mutarotase [Gemmatimonadota bacterium]|nr:galactose mutarotase [Gemmatimonadota bacterium]
MSAPSVGTSTFGTMPAPDGRPVEMFTLRAGGGGAGHELRAITYGGTVVSLRVPDRDGTLADVVLGHDSLQGYLDHSPYFGAIVGRYGNRIANGRFALDGATHQLARNDGGQHLHGGVRGFDKAIWNGRADTSNGDARVSFTLTSPDGDEGYPGALEALVTYTLTGRGELVVDYLARTDRPTIVNLTQHSYFDLSAGRSESILDHELTVQAEAYVPVDATLIPTGQLAPVEGTPFDFRSPMRIGERIGEPHQQLLHAGGYDHSYVLRPPSAGPRSLAPAARVTESTSGRTLDVYTTQPGMQLYSGNFLDGTIRGKAGTIYAHRGGFCLETQHFPDSPNQPTFPSTVLRPGEEYRSRTVYAFGVRR